MPKNVLKIVKYLQIVPKTPKLADTSKKNVARQDYQIRWSYSLVTRIFSNIFDIWYSFLHNSDLWSNFIDLSSTYFIVTFCRKWHHNETNSPILVVSRISKNVITIRQFLIWSFYLKVMTFWKLKFEKCYKL